MARARRTRTVTSALIYLPSSVKDFANPEIDSYLQKYVRGSRDMGHRERIKIMKLLWDATGTEFGGRHALYELNYAGAPEEVRLDRPSAYNALPEQSDQSDFLNPQSAIR